MDLSKIKQKLEELNQERQTGNDYAKYFWNPPMGKTIIRIVPSKDNPDTPFTELYFHNVIAKYPILALTNFGEQDPVEEFRRTLQNAGGKDNWSMSGKLTLELVILHLSLFVGKRIKVFVCGVLVHACTKHC